MRRDAPPAAPTGLPRRPPPAAAVPASGVGVVIPAAGKGERLRRETPKAFVPLAGKPLVLHVLELFQATPTVRWIIVAVRPKDRSRMQQLVKTHRLTKVTAIVEGGPSRAASVSRGVAALPAEAKWVVVHDAARPCLSPRLLDETIRQAQRHGAVACGVPASVTVKAVDDAHSVRLTLEREGLWFVQTPQAFRRDWLEQALTCVKQAGLMPDDPTTCLRSDGPVSQPDNRFPHRSGNGLPKAAPDRWWDDAALLEWAGFPVRMVPGDPLNIKVTTPEDLVLAESILHARGSRWKVQGSRLQPRT